MRCFIDSNIWFYLFADTSQKTRTAETLVSNPTNEVIISVQVINEVCANLLKKAGFSEDRIKEIIRDYYTNFDVSPFSEDVLLKASTIRTNHNFSFWDSVILASAFFSDANTLFSEDMQHGFVFENQVTIINPFQ